MRALARGSVLALVLLASCGVADRPEGVVEDWLTTLNQGRAGEPSRYAVAEATRALLPGWGSCDPGAFAVVEVGRGIRTDGRLGAGRAFEWFVPYRVEYASNLGSLCERVGRPTAPRIGVARVSASDEPGHEPHRVNAVVRRSERLSELRLPSEGGSRVGGASGTDWVLAALVTMVLTVAVAVAMRATPSPAFTPSDLAGPGQAGE